MNESTTRVLVVDDNPLNLELVTDVLEGAGFAIAQATTAESALELVGASAPDLILMDIGLPGMDGHEAVRRLKANPATAGIPVAALTASAMAGDERRALDSGFDAYITKPINTQTLADFVGRLCDAHRARV